MTLEERIEQPLRDRILFIGGEGEAIPTLRDDVAKCVFMGTPAELIRAVVAVLPKADVSDEGIAEALTVRVGLFQDQASLQSSLHANVRALLDAQAAAHAAEMEALRAEVATTTNAYEVLVGVGQQLSDKLAAAEADRDAYRARIDKVRADIELELEGSDGGYTDGLQSALNIIDRYRTALDGDGFYLSNANGRPLDGTL